MVKRVISMDDSGTEKDGYVYGKYIPMYESPVELRDRKWWKRLWYWVVGWIPRRLRKWVLRKTEKGGRSIVYLKDIE